MVQIFGGFESAIHTRRIQKIGVLEIVGLKNDDIRNDLQIYER
jgi:hypothetical protein